MNIQDCFKSIGIKGGIKDGYLQGIQSILADQSNDITEEGEAVLEFIRQREGVLKDNFKNIVNTISPETDLKNFLNEEEATQPQEPVQVQSEESKTTVEAAQKTQPEGKTPDVVESPSQKDGSANTEDIAAVTDDQTRTVVRNATRDRGRELDSDTGGVDIDDISIKEKFNKAGDGESKRVAEDQVELGELERLSGGSDRVVYDLGDGRVLKVAKSPKGIMQNEGLNFGDENILGNIIPKLYEKGKDYIVREFVPRADKAARAFLKPLNKFTQKDFDNKSSELQKVLREMGLEDILNYDVLWGDLKAARNWGQRRDGSFVIIDEGVFSPEVNVTLKNSKVDPIIKKEWEEAKQLRTQARQERKKRKEAKKNGPPLKTETNEQNTTTDPNSTVPDAPVPETVSTTTPTPDTAKQADDVQVLEEAVNTRNTQIKESLEKINSTKVNEHLQGFETEAKGNRKQTNPQKFVQALDDGKTVNAALRELEKRVGRKLSAKDLPKQIPLDVRKELVSEYNNKKVLTEERNNLVDNQKTKKDEQALDEKETKEKGKVKEPKGGKPEDGGKTKEEEEIEGNAKFAKRVKKDSSVDKDFRNKIDSGILNKEVIPNNITNAEADLLIKKIPEDRIINVINDVTIPERIRALIGQKLVRKFSNEASKLEGAAKTDKYDKAITVLNDTIMISREAGRTVQIFSVWQHMGPEGFIYYAQKSLNQLQENVSEKFSFIIEDVLKEHTRTKKRVVKSFAKADATKASKLSTKASEIRKRALAKIKKAGGNLTSGGLSPELIEGLVEYGYSIVLTGVDSFNEFSKKMRGKFSKLTAADVSVIWNNKYEGKTLKDHSEELGVDMETFILSNFEKDNFTELLADRLSISNTDAKKLVSNLETKIKRSLEVAIRKAIPQKHKKMRDLSKNLANYGNLTKKDVAKELYDYLGFPQNLDEETLDGILKDAEKIENLPDNSEIKDHEIGKLMSSIYDQLGDRAPEFLHKERGSIFWGLWYASVLAGIPTQALNTGANAFKAVNESFITSMQEWSNDKDPERLFRGWAPIQVMGKAMFTPGVATSDFADILFRGKSKSRQPFKFFDSSELERRGKTLKNPFKLQENLSFGSPKEVFNNTLDDLAWAAKIVPRFMSAVDAWFYWGHHSARVAQLVNRFNIEQGLTGAKLRTAMNDAVFGDALAISQARAQATAELRDVELIGGGTPTKSDIRRRTDEILEESIKKIYPQEIWDSAVEWGQRGTFTQKPEGALGQGVVPIIKQLHRIKFVGGLARIIVPFTNVVANVMNDQLDYTFVGLYRSGGGGVGANMSAEMRNRIAIKAAMGMLVTIPAMVYLMALFDPEDEDSLIKIHGDGPKDFGKRLQLMATNWKPYSLQIGDVYLSYKELPIGLFLGMIGNSYDSSRYEKMSEDKLEAAIESAFYQARDLPRTMFEASFLSGITPFVDLIGRVYKSKPEKATELLGNWMIDQTKVVQPNFYRGISKAFDPNMYSTSNWKERFYKTHYQPWLSITGQKSGLVTMQNALGDDIKFSRGNAQSTLAGLTGVSRFVNIADGDPVYDLLARKNYLIKPLSTLTTIDDKVIFNTDRRLYLKINKIRGGLIKDYLKENLEDFEDLTRSEIESRLEPLLDGKKKGSFTKIAKDIAVYGN